MIHDAGNSCLIVALFFALLQGLFPLWGYKRSQPYLLAVARPAALGQCLLLLGAYSLLTFAFLQQDFSLTYVAQNSHPTLPLMYQIAALWGAHEGSLLLWVFVTTLWTLAFAYFAPKNAATQLITPLTIAILGCISVGFLALLICTSNPFNVNTTQQLGLDLNPLLQDPAFILHPPLLYVGYIGFAVPFALTIAALIHGQLDQSWARLARQFTLAAWCVLTLGIILGSWWAYRLFGWGGFWFWDPVENASLLPWVCGIAFIHALRAAEHHPPANLWAALLGLLTFSLSILGTFLTRSGMFISAHAFALDPTRSLFLLLLFSFSVMTALFIYMHRYAHINTHKVTHLLWSSREMGLLFNSGLLCVATLTILLGTVYPIILDVLGLAHISVGAPYFNQVLTPVVFLIMLMMGSVPYCRWRTVPATSLRAKLLKQGALSVAIAVIVMWGLGGQSEWRPLISLMLCAWIILSVRPHVRWQPGMSIAHIGFAVMIIGVTLVTLLSDQREVLMQIGDSVAVGPYEFRLLDIVGIRGSNYRGVRANFAVTKSERHITYLYPEKRIYLIRDVVTTKVAISPGIFRDLYIALGAPHDHEQWSVRVYYKPFIRWIWTGGLLMCIGGFCAMLRRRACT